jgi:hypothetical protein
MIANLETALRQFRIEPNERDHRAASLHNRTCIYCGVAFDPDLLASGRLPHLPMCPNRLSDLRHNLYDNGESDSITTLFRRVSDVGLGYTSEQRQSSPVPPVSTSVAPREKPAIKILRLPCFRSIAHDVKILSFSYMTMRCRSRRALGRSVDGQWQEWRVAEADGLFQGH